MFYKMAFILTHSSGDKFTRNCNSCNWTNSNSKKFNKMCLIFKRFLLVVTLCWCREMRSSSDNKLACLSCYDVILLRRWTLSGSISYTLPLQPQDCVRVPVGIVLAFFARQCTSTLKLWDG